MSPGSQHPPVLLNSPWCLCIPPSTDPCSLPCPGVPPCTPSQRVQQRQRQPHPCPHHPRDAPEPGADPGLHRAPQGWVSPAVPCRAGLSLTGHLHLGLALQQGSQPVADDEAVEAGVCAVQRRDHVPVGQRSHLSSVGDSQVTVIALGRGCRSHMSPPIHCWAANPAPGDSAGAVQTRVFVHICAHWGDTWCPPLPHRDSWPRTRGGCHHTRHWA